MAATVLFGTLVIILSVAHEHSAGTTGSVARKADLRSEDKSPPSSYTSVVVHKDGPSASPASASASPSSAGGLNLQEPPEGWPFSEVHINFHTKDKQSKPQTQEKKLRNVYIVVTSTEATKSKILPRGTFEKPNNSEVHKNDIKRISASNIKDGTNLNVDNIGQESSPQVSKSIQDYGDPSVSLGYSIGIASPPDNSRVNNASPFPTTNAVVASDNTYHNGATNNNSPSAHSFSVSNLNLPQGIRSTALNSHANNNNLGEIITGRQTGVYIQGLPTNNAQGNVNQKYVDSYDNGKQYESNAQTQQNYQRNDGRLQEHNNGQFGLRNNVNKIQIASNFNSGQFRNNVGNEQFHRQNTLQTQNHSNIQSNVFNNGRSELVGSSAHSQTQTPSKIISHNAVGNVNNAQVSGRSTHQIQNNNVPIHNFNNGYSNPIVGTNQAPSPTNIIPQTRINNVENIQTLGFPVQQVRNNNNAQVHSKGVRYSELPNTGHRAQNNSPSKGISHHGNTENRNLHFTSASNINSNSYRNNPSVDRNVNNPVANNVKLTFPVKETIRRENENCHTEQTTGTPKYYGSVQNTATYENGRHPSNGVSHINFNFHKSQERNPDSSLSASNYQQSFTVQSKPINFGVTSTDINNVNSLPWRNFGSGIVINSGNVAHNKEQSRGINEARGVDNTFAYNHFLSKHPPLNGAPIPQGGLAQNQAIYFLDNGKQNSNIPQHITTKDAGFDHVNALGNINTFDHKDALVSQTQHNNNMQQSANNQVNQNIAHAGNDFTVNTSPQYNTFNDNKYNSVSPNFNFGNGQLLTSGSAHNSAAQVTNNKNINTSSNKDVNRLEPTVLNIPGQPVVNQEGVSVVNGIQPHSLFLNTGHFNYPTLHDGQILSSQQHNGNFASLPGIIPASGTPLLSHNNGNNLFSTSNHQTFTSQLFPLNIHASQTPSSGNLPVGGTVLGGHNLPESSLTVQPTFTDNLTPKPIQTQFVSTGSSNLPGENVNRINQQFLNYQNLVAGTGQQLHLQLEKGTNQDITTANKIKDINAEVQVNSQSQLSNTHLFPHSFQLIHSANQETQKNINGLHNTFHDGRQPIQGVDTAEGQHHIQRVEGNSPQQSEKALQNGRIIQTHQQILQSFQNPIVGSKHVNVNAEPNYFIHGQNRVQGPQGIVSNEASYLQPTQQISQPARLINLDTYNPTKEVNDGSRVLFTGFVPEHRNVGTIGVSGIQTLSNNPINSPRILLGGLSNNVGLPSSVLSFNRHSGLLRGVHGRSLFSMKNHDKENPNQQKLHSLSISNHSSHLTDNGIFKTQSSVSPQLQLNNKYLSGVQSNPEAIHFGSGAQIPQQHGISFLNSNVNLRQLQTDQWHGPSGDSIRNSGYHVQPDSNAVKYNQPSYMLSSSLRNQNLVKTPQNLNSHSSIPNAFYILNMSQFDQSLPHLSPQIQLTSQPNVAELKKEAPHYLTSPVEQIVSGSHLHAQGQVTGRQTVHQYNVNAAKGRSQRKLVSSNFQKTETVKPVTEPSEEIDIPDSSSAFRTIAAPDFTSGR